MWKGAAMHRLTSTAVKPGMFACALAVGSLLKGAAPLHADEGGIGLWLPGTFGSLAAVPQTPGWSLGTVYIHTSAGASGDVAAAREFTIGRFNRSVNLDLNLNLGARADMVAVAPTYVFATPVFGGQLAVSLMGVYGRPVGSLDGTLTATAGPLVLTRMGSIDDARTVFGDLYPQFTQRWNNGVHNFMVYGFGDIPVGAYDPSRLANVGLGHGGIDGGAGYTYFDAKTGYEFSVVSGLTYNFKNTHTDYQNGINWHVDWGFSKFLTKEFQVGGVGYFYQQLTADRGAPAFLGDNKSRIAGIGPQVGYVFPVAGMQGYLNLKGYWEFAAEHRASGWNAWLTFAISPAPPTETPSKAPMLRK